MARCCLAVGGRGAQSALYRVTYVGNESTAPSQPDTRFQAQRDLRHKLEAFHGKKDAAAVEAVWPYLGDQDRAIRYAARIALEWQDVAQWREKALAEKDPRKAIAAIVALARVSGKDAIHRKDSDPAPDPKPARADARRAGQHRLGELEAQRIASTCSAPIRWCSSASASPTTPRGSG